MIIKKGILKKGMIKKGNDKKAIVKKKIIKKKIVDPLGHPLFSPLLGDPPKKWVTQNPSRKKVGASTGMGELY